MQQVDDTLEKNCWFNVRAIEIPRLVYSQKLSFQPVGVRVPFHSVLDVGKSRSAHTAIPFCNIVASIIVSLMNESLSPYANLHMP